MRVNSHEYACLIDQFWFEKELHVSSSRIQIFESLLCSLLSRPSLSHACSLMQISLSFLQLTHTLTSCFSYPRKYGLSTSPLTSVKLSLSLYITWFSLSLTSLILWYHQVPKLSFSPPHTQSHSSFTLSFSLWGSLTHPICLQI